MSLMNWLRKQFWPAPALKAAEANIRASRALAKATEKLAARMDGRLPETTAAEVAAMFDRRRENR